MRFYRRDLRADLFGVEAMGVRRLRALILGLPPDAMVWRGVPGWGTDQELLALNAEVSHAIVRVLVAAFSKKSGGVPKPLRIPRPGSPAGSTKAPADRARPLRPDDLARIGAAVQRMPAGEVLP